MRGVGTPREPLSLRTALRIVHRDARWWLHCLGYGAIATSFFGLPLVAGFVIESYDNSKRGFPTPLPPWVDLSTRYLAGIFALVIDFTFFALPGLIGGVLTFCAGLALALALGGVAGVQIFFLVAAGLLFCMLVALFMLSVSPVGRLRFADEGRIEDALSGETLRYALSRTKRANFLRARLYSLVAYLPALALLGVGVRLSSINFAAQGLILLVLWWLFCSAVVYAHLVVVQLYVAAEAAS
ncbi:MAG: DUF4013 domain-containing protein [Candidatus Viridilinea halotolerans]|uniref:DUF4013 domain-containing protein n=1 Tax=Candidatus Viridilinea halotolerans TaxID=2491704 RepID=A0A426TVR7_9CHLR|nr:MAG: DUF4013 domain-containing protein [Candidatus Viridilinea halotolerans]